MLEKNNAQPRKEMIEKIIASKVGEEAAQRLIVWYEHYQKLSTLIDKIYNAKNEIEAWKISEKANLEKTDEIIITVIGVLYRFVQNAQLWVEQDKKNGKKKAREKAKTCLKWAAKAPADIRNAAFRAVYDDKLYKDLELHMMDEIFEIFLEMSQMQNEIKQSAKRENESQAAE